MRTLPSLHPESKRPLHRHEMAVIGQADDQAARLWRCAQCYFVAECELVHRHILRRPHVHVTQTRSSSSPVSSSSQYSCSRMKASEPNVVVTAYSVSTSWRSREGTQKFAPCRAHRPSASRRRHAASTA